MKSIAIIGGGVAGWFTALKLEKSFRQKKLKPQITLIESPDDPIIGVGEATVDSFPYFLKELDISTSEFVSQVKATFKNGILFENWNPQRPLFFHPYFGSQPTEDVVRSSLKNSEPIDRLFISTYLAKHHMSPCQVPGEPNIHHAYHFDTAKLATFLSRVAKKRGVKHKVEKVASVVRQSDGTICNLKFSNGQQIKADFYFDCSGFQSVLLGKGLDLKFISFADYLLNDSALAGHAPLKQFKTNPPTYTKATAMKNGWRWSIPTSDRFGMGYVYSSKYTDDKSAEKEFRFSAQLPKETELKKIKMKIGHYEKFMFKNCIGIGLSVGFIEPLESSGLVFIIHGLKNFVDLLFEQNQNFESEYNKRMRTLFESTGDFVAVHFMLSTRSDTPYWRHQGTLLKNNTRVQKVCQYIDRVIKTPFDYKVASQKVPGWDIRNYLCILDGLGYFNKFQKSLLSKNKEQELSLLGALPLWNEESAKTYLSHRQGLAALMRGV